MASSILSRRVSPLEQARRSERPAGPVAVDELSLRDQATLRTILASKLDFVPSKLFAKSDAYEQIFVEPEAIPRPDTSWYHPVMESISDSRSGNSVGTVLLTAAQERTLFLQFNFCRYQVAQLGTKAKKGELDVASARLLLEWYRRSEAFRDQIAQTNLALVLAMAKRTRMSDVDFSDLVSEGNMALLRAIDKFDVARGFKFSTYACRAILKAFSRMGVKLSKYRQLFPTDFDPKLERSNFLENKREGHEDDCVDEIRRIIKDNRADLSPIEKEVIEHRFALGKRRQTNPDAAPLTLEQVGQIIGVTKERVRQIQNKALDKIRLSLENGFLA